MEAARLRNLRDLIIPAHWQNIPVSQILTVNLPDIGGVRLEMQLNFF